ncbi:MAG: Mor transcription activator family protein [Negativibacillus massiliensis]|nr:Mor transcription activator family protein [Negativibacillus massiliensis]
MIIIMDKYKDIEIILKSLEVLEYGKEVTEMAIKDPELLNNVYKEISERLGMDTAMEIYRMFKGQQISFPVRFFNPAKIQKLIIEEYNGTNLKILATKYNYSEKTVRRIIKESLEK